MNFISKMKKVKFGALIAFSLACMGTFSYADDWTPFPWGFQQDFPWTNIEGTWATISAYPQTDLKWTFYFRVSYQKNSVGNLLRVSVYDSESCRLVAQGQGIERDGVVLSQVSGRNGAYRMKFASFEPYKAKRHVSGLYKDGVFAASISKISNRGGKSPVVEMQIVKQSQTEVVSSKCQRP